MTEVHNVLIAVRVEELVRWAAALTKADSQLSLIYHRARDDCFGGVGMLDKADVREGFIKARQASEEVKSFLSEHGVDDHEIAREMQRPSWARAR